MESGHFTDATRYVPTLSESWRNLQLTCISGVLQKQGRLCYILTELFTWCSLPSRPLLPTTVLPKRPRLVTYCFCCHDKSYGCRPGGIFNPLWAIHFSSKALWRDHLDWIRAMDSVRQSIYKAPHIGSELIVKHHRACGLMLLFGAQTHPAAVAVIVAIMGAGVGFTFQPTLVALQAHCTKSQRAVVIANRNFFRCIGGACGLAVCAAILQATLRSNLPPKFAYLAESSYSLPSRANLSDNEWSAILLSYSKASHAVFILQVPLIGVCFLACLFIRDRGLERPKEPEEIEEEKQRAQGQRDTEAAISEHPESEDHQTHGQIEKRHSASTLAGSLMPPRADPNSEAPPEKHPR